MTQPQTEKKYKSLKPSEERERKAFDLIKTIPVVGLVYRAGRAMTFKMKKDQEEVIHSLTIDVANLNPIRVASELTRAVFNTAHEYDKGVWIGKCSILKCKIGLTIKPNTDLWHYAIMIKGLIFHVPGVNEFIRIEESDDLNLKKSFEWRFFTNKIIKTEDEIKRTTRNFESFKYKIIPKWQDEANSQTFVTFMLSFVTGWDHKYCDSKLNKILGTFIV